MARPSPLVDRLSRSLIWLLLALPALGMIWASYSGRADAMDLLHPSGETSARLLIFAMMIGPLNRLFGPRGWTLWLMRRRRWIGVAAFGYAALHLVYYLIDMELSLALMLDEIDAPAIWTGWLALALMLPPALTSHDAAMRALRRNWKRVQQLTYAVALLTLIHWGLIEYEWQPGLIHFAPLIMLHLAALIRRFLISVNKRTSS